MSQIKLAGIRREIKYSPNHVEADAMIFDLTVRHLVEMGYEVKEYTETEFISREMSELVVFGMVRSKAAIDKLKILEDNGKIIVNSGFGIENCTRERMTRLLLENDIPHPRSIIVRTTEDPFDVLSGLNIPAYWVKRGDFHALQSEDISYVENIMDVRHVLEEFALRGIPNAVINEHLDGDLVKLYGVAGTDFCYYFYPSDQNYSKFGHEIKNGTAKYFPFSKDELKAAFDKAADVLNVKIYGGDCIVSKDGSFRIIDFNDWPSFASCRNEAAPKIAESIHKEIVTKLK